MVLTYKETLIIDKVIDEKLHSSSSPTQFVFHWYLLIIKELQYSILRCQPKSNPSISFLLCRSQRVRISSKRIWLLFLRQTHSLSAVSLESLILAGWSGAEQRELDGRQGTRRQSAKSKLTRVLSDCTWDVRDVSFYNKNNKTLFLGIEGWMPHWPTRHWLCVYVSAG